MLPMQAQLTGADGHNYVGNINSNGVVHCRVDYFPPIARLCEVCSNRGEDVSIRCYLVGKVVSW